MQSESSLARARARKFIRLTSIKFINHHRLGFAFISEDMSEEEEEEEEEEETREKQD